MGTIRRFLMTLLGAKGGSAIAVGSHITPTGRQDVAITLADGWKHSKARLSPDGARRIAAQMTEWAAAADKHNAELESNQTIIRWKRVIGDALSDSKQERDA